MVQHLSVKTTDVAVEDIQSLRPWLRELLRTRLYPMVAEAFPKLADGLTTTVHDSTTINLYTLFDSNTWIAAATARTKEYNDNVVFIIAFLCTSDE